jgi:hypothetical protein
LPLYRYRSIDSSIPYGLLTVNDRGIVIYQYRPNSSRPKRDIPNLKRIMTSPQGNLTEAPTRPTYTCGTSPATEWDDRCAEQTANAEANIAQIQQAQREVAAEFPEAAEAASFFLPGSYDDLLRLLDHAEALVWDEMGSYEYREVWERRWTETARYWELVNLRRVGERVRELVDLLRECESRAAELGEYVEMVRSALPV